jgi:DNA repair protein RadD
MGAEKMPVVLRDYQILVLENLRTAARALPRDQRRLLLVAPMGAGKTTIAAELIKGALARSTAIVFLAHSKELIDQASARLDVYGIEHGVIRADDKRIRPDSLVQVCSVQTLRQRNKPPAGLIIVDEAHRSRGESYKTILAAYPNATVIGLTATPCRLDGKGLGSVFNVMIEAVKVNELVRDGVLVGTRVYVPSLPDLSNVETKRGDYDEAQLADAMNKPQLVGDIVTHWLKLGDGRRTVVFATNIEHSQAVCRAFLAAGIVARHIDGKTKPNERAAILHGLAEGSITVVCNVNVLCEGFDCQPLAVAILARPTQSLALHLQQVGRVLRSFPGKTEALILDHAGNTFRHGMATLPRAWSLESGKTKEPAPPIKTCPQCYVVLPSSVRVCPDCQHEWTPEQRDRALRIDGNGCLVEYTPLPPPKPLPSWLAAVVPTNPKKATKAEKRRVFDTIDKERQRREYEPGWASHQYRAVFDVWPRGLG